MAPSRLWTLVALLAGVASVGVLWANVRSSGPSTNSVVAPEPPRNCRTSAFTGVERSSEGNETRLTVPASDNPLQAGVEIDVTTNAGSASSSTFVQLREPRTERSVEATFGIAFDRMMSRHPVPQGLKGAENATWRRMVEDAAFERICSQVDPSLERLLRPGSLHWRSCEP